MVLQPNNMKKVYNSILELIGNTPLIRLNKLEKLLNLKAKLYVKLEGKNPGGSAKDRPALEMVREMIEKKEINKDTILIEPTSGNTEIGLAMFCAYLDIKLKIIMPSNMSVERIKLMKGYGAEVILTDAVLGMKGAISKAKELNREIKNSRIVGQFENPANPKAHFESTGPEIYEALNHKVDYFVSAIGTGGTITGVGTYLKSQIDNVKIIGVEPEASPFITKGIAGKHEIQGIGAGFIPAILDIKVIDEMILCSNLDAYEYAKLLAKKEGILVGISSGAALMGGITIARREENKGKAVVVLLPDTAERYLSTSLFD